VGWAHQGERMTTIQYVKVNVVEKREFRRKEASFADSVLANLHSGMVCCCGLCSECEVHLDPLHHY
jgi:hypothetical protein